jgi:hypothetical protein
MWRSMPSRASASITGPTSTASRAGLPMQLSAIAPLSISTSRSAASSCTHSTRSAEQRWPALSKAEAITSATTCSVSADESTIIAFCPPVSAMSGTGAPCGAEALRERLLQQPRDLGRAGEHHALHARIGHQRGAHGFAAAGQQLHRARGTPASHSTRTASAATSGVCSAGLASTGLPAASAAATWPVKIASGKFHGLMHTIGPSARCVSLEKSSRACAA